VSVRALSAHRLAFDPLRGLVTLPGPAPGPSPVPSSSSISIIINPQHEADDRLAAVSSPTSASASARGGRNRGRGRRDAADAAPVTPHQPPHAYLPAPQVNQLCSLAEWRLATLHLAQLLFSLPVRLFNFTLSWRFLGYFSLLSSLCALSLFFMHFEQTG
jgi:hypothetical protein